MPATDPFRLGVNYWPSATAMEWLPRADDHRPDHPARVVDTADAAAEIGLQLIVTLFTGHMSGVNWVPGWATGGDDGDDRFRVMSGGVVQDSGRRHHLIRLFQRYRARPGASVG